MKNKIITLISLCLLVLGLGGCRSSKSVVTTTVYPVEYLIKSITGDKIEVINVTEGGFILRSTVGEDFSEQLKNSDLFIYIGGLEPYLQTHFQEVEETSIPVLDITAKTRIYNFARYSEISSPEGVVYIESQYYDNAAFSTVDIYSSDPYVWLDPLATTSMASQIKDWLVKKYPENRDLFNKNYEKLVYDLALLDTDFQRLKNRSSKIKLVTMTPTFGPWQKNYGISIYPVILSKYGVLPTDEQLAVIKQKIVNDNVKYIVYEDNFPEDVKVLYESLISELGLKKVTLSNLTLRTPQEIEDQKDYLQIMYENLFTLENLE